MSEKNIHIIINPTAGGGIAGKTIPSIRYEAEKRFRPSYTLRVTREAGDATTLTRNAILGGAKLIVAAGGDGTIQEVVNGFFQDHKLINPSCELGIINFGTGSGLAQTLGLPSSLAQQLDILSHTSGLKMDVGRVFWYNKKGEKNSRYFVSECQAGIGGAVVAGVNKNHKILGGKIAFGSVTIKQTFCYKGFSASIKFDGNNNISQDLTGIVIGNGSHCGGGMQLTPEARLDDGLFDILLIHKTNTTRLLHSFTKIYSGKHLESKYFTLIRTKKVTIDTTETVPMEADGELLGTIPCEISMVPAAIKVKTVKHYKLHYHAKYSSVYQKI